MKLRGFSGSIVHLCSTLNNDYIDLLEDISQYLYGREYISNINTLAWNEFKFKHQHTDTVEIENYLRTEATNSAFL